MTPIILKSFTLLTLFIRAVTVLVVTVNAVEPFNIRGKTQSTEFPNQLFQSLAYNLTTLVQCYDVIR